MTVSPDIDPRPAHHGGPYAAVFRQLHEKGYQLDVRWHLTRAWSRVNALATVRAGLDELRKIMRDLRQQSGDFDWVCSLDGNLPTTSSARLLLGTKRFNLRHKDPHAAWLRIGQLSTQVVPIFHERNVIKSLLTGAEHGDGVVYINGRRWELND
jgi:hypothetical protein